MLAMLPVALVTMRATAVRAEPNPSSSERNCQQVSVDCVVEGKWHFALMAGAGARTNPLFNGRTIPLVLIPQVSYYGRRFFLNNLDLGFTVAESGANSLSLVASPGYDRVFFYRSDLQNIFITGFSGGSAAGVGVNGSTGVRSGAGAYTVAANSTALQPSGASRLPVLIPDRARGLAYLAGPEWTFRARGFTGQLDLLKAITGQHQGTEARVALGVQLLKSPGVVAVSIGVTWKNAALVNYFYGAPGVYAAGSALNPFLKVSYSKSLGDRWKVRVLAHYEKLGKGIVNSPLVVERYVTTVFAGVSYGL